MKGIKYLTDDKNRKVAVQIDLKKYGKLWEDFYDILIAKERENEPRISLEELKKELKKEGKL
jgi:molybdate-binding protein